MVGVPAPAPDACADEAAAPAAAAAAGLEEAAVEVAGTAGAASAEADRAAALHPLMLDDADLFENHVELLAGLDTDLSQRIPVMCAEAVQPGQLVPHDLARSYIAGPSIATAMLGAALDIETACHPPLFQRRQLWRPDLIDDRPQA